MDVLLKPFKKKGANAKSKHEKLPENWGKDKGPLHEGVLFYAKYLGSTLVEELQEEGASYGEGISSNAVKTIVNMAKMSGNKLPKMAIHVSKNGIRVINQVTKEVRTDMSIFRISFCTADRNHDKVFAFIARNLENETMECQAFLCPKRKIAQAITLTVAQAFNCAKDDWEAKENNEQCALGGDVCSTSDDNTPGGESGNLGCKDTSPTKMLIVIDDRTQESSDNRRQQDGSSFLELSGPQGLSPYVQPKDTSMSFEDNFNDVEDDFSSLAKSRIESRSRVTPTSRRTPFPFGNFSTGLRPEDIEEGVVQLMGGQTPSDDLNRTTSMDDLKGL